MLELRPAEPGHATSDAAVAVLYDQIRAVILGTAGLLLVLATINAWIVATFAARDAARATRRCSEPSAPPHVRR